MNTAGFALPAYWSMEAIFTMGKADDTQWLTVCSSPNHTRKIENLYTDMTYSTGSSTPS